MIKRKQKDDITWLEFDLLTPFSNLKHASFLKGNDFDLGDEGDPIYQKRVLSLMGLEQGVKLKQCHKTCIKKVEIGSPGWQQCDGFDALITDQCEIALMIRHADCQAAIFFDPKHLVIGAAHCGWRGSVQGIYHKMIDAMHFHYHTSPSDLLVCISPSLGPLAAEFTSFKEILPPHFWPYQVKPTFFDFLKISLDQLVQAGVKKEHIEIADICTYSSNQDCFSYRRGSKIARHGTVVALLNHI